MSHRKFFLFLPLTAAILLLNAGAAHACSCIVTPPAFEAYQSAEFVIIARAVSVDKADESEHYGGVRSTQLTVEKVFKGSLKVGEKMTFGQGGGADCIWTFSEEDVGKQFLFYLGSYKETPGVWMAGTCGRSDYADRAIDDLLYLNNIAKHKGQSRLSGTLSFYQPPVAEGDKPIYKRLSGKKVRISGNNKVYELTTNEGGVYEIYDLPAGTYEIEPEVPVGWKISHTSGPRLIADLPRLGEEPKSPNTIRLLLAAGQHRYLDVGYKINNVIRGTVFDNQGNPLNRVCLDIIPAQGKKSQYSYKMDCTEPDGSFSIDDIPPGNYVLAINEDGKITSDEPFPTFYYPSTLERAKATVITMGEGGTIATLNVQAPSMVETITVSGTLLYADGKPGVRELVSFEVANTGSEDEDGPRVLTDAEGHFSVKILKGQKGQLFGTRDIYIGVVKHCPKLVQALKESGRDTMEMKTLPLNLTAETNQYDVELKFPFPSCKKETE